MGNLIRFDSRRRIIPGQTLPKGEAEVLIFTGVRYERSDDTDSSTMGRKVIKSTQRRKRKRS